MDSCLIRLIKAAVDKNDTSSLKQFITSKRSNSLNINKKTIEYLRSIICDNKNKLKGTKCVLSFIKYFYDKKPNQNILNNLEKPFSELCLFSLYECVAFYEKYDEEETVLYYLSDIISELVCQSEYMVKYFHFYMVPYLINNITKKDFSFAAKNSLAKTLSAILKFSGIQNHCEINPHFENEIATFTNWIFLCGDYELQIIILETLLYILSGIENRDVFCAKWFNLYPQIQIDFLKRCFTDFEPEARIFLNLVNKLNKYPLVHSIGCVSIFSDGIQLEKPNDSNYHVFWVDFNTCSENVTFYIKGETELWDTFQIKKHHISEVYSCSDECNRNNKIIPIIKLCFTLSGNISTASNLEIWFEISEEFCNIENRYLIPVYGSIYQSNWRASLRSNILSSKVLELNHSVEDKLHLKEHVSSSVVETNEFIPLKNKNGQNLKELQTVFEHLDSSCHKNSDDNNKKIQVNQDVKEPEIDDTFVNSCNTIISSPNIQVQTSKKTLNKNKEKNTNASCEEKYKCSTTNKKSDIVEASYENLYVNVINEGNGTNKKSDTDLLTKTNRNYESNRPKKRVSSGRFKKLFSSDKFNESNCNTPLYDSSQDSGSQSKISRYITTKSFCPYTTKKPLKRTCKIAPSCEKITLNHEENYIKIKTKEKSQGQKNDKQFFNSAAACSAAAKSTPDPAVAASSRKTKSVYSDFSTSSFEILKPIKKTYSKPSISIKKKTVSHMSSISEDVCKTQSSMPKIAKKDCNPGDWYVTRLECDVDPLRSKDEEDGTSFGNVDAYNEIIKQKEFVKSHTELTLPTENLHIHCEEELNIEPIVSSVPENNISSLQLNKQYHLDNIQIRNGCNQQKEFSSDCEVRDMEICIGVNQTVDESEYSSEVPTTQSRNENVLPVLNEDLLYNFGMLLLKNLRKKIEEADKDIMLEKETFYINYMSELELLKKNIAVISAKLESAIKAIASMNEEIDNIRTNEAKTMSQYELKHSMFIAKYFEGVEEEMKTFAKSFFENTNK